MDNYKELESQDLIKKFDERESLKSKLNIVTVGQIEEILNFKMSDFENDCKELKAAFDEDLTPVVGLQKITDFFFTNKKKITELDIDMSPFIEILNNYDIGSIIYSYLTPELEDCQTIDPFYTETFESAIRCVSILAYFPSSNFGSFLSGGRLYPIIFKWFVNTRALVASREIVQDMLSILINVSYIENKEDDPFEMYQENAFFAISDFLFSFKMRQVGNEKFDSEYAIRVFTEIAKWHPNIFDINENRLLRDYFDVNLTQKSYYPALKFASYIMKYYSEVNECHMLFFDLFKERFFVLSKNNDYAQSQEMVFFIQFIEFFDDFGTLCDMLSEIKIFDQINVLLENNKISHNAMNLIITLMDKTGRVILNGKFTDISLFDIYIRENFEDEITGFINLIQKNYDNMNIFAKRISFTIFSKLLDNSHAANVVISEYNYDGLNDILQSAPKDMIIIAIDFLSECINKTVKISQGAFEELLDKLDESEVPSIFDELADSDDQDVSERAKMIIDRIKSFTQDDDDDDGD